MVAAREEWIAVKGRQRRLESLNHRSQPFPSFLWVRPLLLEKSIPTSLQRVLAALFILVHLIVWDTAGFTEVIWLSSHACIKERQTQQTQTKRARCWYWQISVCCEASGEEYEYHVQVVQPKYTNHEEERGDGEPYEFEGQFFNCLLSFSRIFVLMLFVCFSSRVGPFAFFPLSFWNFLASLTLKHPKNTFQECWPGQSHE